MPKPSRGLLDEPPLLIQPSLAKAIGVNEAIVVQQVHYWLQENEKNKRNYINGRYWTYNNVSEWQRQFSFWSYDGVKKILARLKAMRVLDAERLSSDKRDRTLYYTINYQRLEELLDDAKEDDPTGGEENALMHEVRRTPCTVDQVPHVYKEAETTTESGAFQKNAKPKKQKLKAPVRGDMLEPDGGADADDLSCFKVLTLDEYSRGLERDGVEHLARNPYRPGLPSTHTPTQRCPNTCFPDGAVTERIERGDGRTPVRACVVEGIYPKVIRPRSKHHLRVAGGKSSARKNVVAHMRSSRGETP